MKCQKSFFSCASSVESALLPCTATFSPGISLDSHVLPLERMACSFWRWRQIWKTPFGGQKASSGSVWALLHLGYKEHGQTDLLETGSSVDLT
ncbi:hypothetical protein Taro_005329 [Colocasia esculenta]|uniref:Uncharacterized protein n=1 Tax=Colocasia esculenta TaxID=4460 RepID=A0A843TMQ6_COLES|nr:hypothetical protein [Colocasia esculenta]